MCNSKVTIIIPVYNGADTISRTIDSLIAQTYDDWIALVIMMDLPTERMIS